MNSKPTSESRTAKANIVLPPDTNHHGTLFGGKLMAYIDDIAAISATRHARQPTVTASLDSVDFLQPIKAGDVVCLESFVSWTGTTSMEVFVKVTSEDRLSGARKVCAISYLTFVAVDEDGKPVHIPQVEPETEFEKELFNTGASRAEQRKVRRMESKHAAEQLGTAKMWQ